MLKALRGTKDILPSETRLWQYIESSARDIFAIYGYKEIRTPIIEEAALFRRGIGDNTDIVKKEMYVFSDRGGRVIALRPEATASIARAYLENSLGQKEGLTKVFYIGPMFRSERPQKGRQRQFHQLGVEAIGSDNPFLDVEVISLAVKFLKGLGIEKIGLKINSLGCPKDKSDIIKKYRQAVKPYLGALCDECKLRYDKNVMRVFDCKNARCGEIIKKAALRFSLCDECKGHFESVKKGLEKLSIDYVVDTKVVRGLDYYTKTVFEITEENLGSKDAICAGGRYNNLIQEIGGKYTPATGFAFGIERLRLAIERDFSGPSGTLDVFVASVDRSLYEEAFMLMSGLRDEKISCEIDYEKRSLKAQMRKAERLKARFVVIFGKEEYGKNKVALKDMESGEQLEIALQDIAGELKARKGIK